jgi:hypothetical protein
MTYQEIVTSIKRLPPEQRLSLMELLAQLLRADLSPKAEQDDWQLFSMQGLSAAHGEDEPEYPVSLIKEPNPTYESNYLLEHAEKKEKLARKSGGKMASTEITTIVKMMEGLPNSTQARLVEHVRAYLADLEDEALWDEQFAHTQNQLKAAAQKARQEIQADRAKPMDFERL